MQRHEGLGTMLIFKVTDQQMEWIIMNLSCKLSKYVPIIVLSTEAT